MDHLSRIEAKIDKLDDRLDSTNEKLARYNSQLEVHIQRSDSLEKTTQALEARCAVVEKKFYEFSGMWKLLAGAATLAGLLEVGLHIFDLLRKLN